MKVLGAILLLLGALAALPLLLNLIRPLWWYDWFNQTGAPPTPKDLATAIWWSTMCGYTAGVLALPGVILLIFGFDSSRTEGRR